MSVLMTDLSGLNLANGTFNASMYIGIRCPDPCDRDAWDVQNTQWVSRTLVSQEPGVTWWLISGTFTFDPQLQLFPFDTQYLGIDIEHRLADAGDLVFVADVATSEVTPGATIAGWQREQFEFTTSSAVYESLGTDYSRASFVVPFTRGTIASITKYYIPLAIFVLVSVATLALARFDIQIASAGAGLVGITVFYLATSTGSGTVGYVTVWDLSMLMGYVALGLVLVCGVIGTRRADAGLHEEEEGAERARQLRHRFLAAELAVILVGSAGIVVVAIAT